MFETFRKFFEGYISAELVCTENYSSNRSRKTVKVKATGQLVVKKMYYLYLPWEISKLDCTTEAVFFFFVFFL